MKHLYESVFSGALLALLVAAPLPSQAQTPQAPTQAEAQAALNPAPASFTNAQLDQMVAPIALYPDQLLTQVLMAATFPQQLVDAQKWLEDSHNASLKGDDLANALTPLPWDPSVKSLVAFPQVIAMMTNHLDWTQALGTAFADQEVQVFARVQFLRVRAKNSGVLQSTSQIAVTEQDTDIVIEPTDPNMLYVPVYNPADVYGAWPDADYPPVFLPPPPGFYSGAIGAGIGFSVGLGIVGPLWGWGHPDWHNHSVAIDPGRYQHITTQTYIQSNHINIEGGAWHRSGPVAFVPEAQRPHPTYQSNEAPKGTVRPSEAFHPGAAGPRPAGAAPGAHPNEAAPGPHPAGEAAHPNEAAPGPHPAGEAAHPNEAAPGPHPAGEAAHPGETPPGPHPAGEAAHPNEAAPGPHPAGEAAHPGETPPGPHPAGEAAHPNEAAPAGPHPAGEAAHPNEAAPGPRPAGEAQPGPRPAGEPPHPEEHAAPQGAPPHPEEARPPEAAPHPAEAPRPEEHAAPAPPRPEEHAAPAPHPAAPPPHPAGPAPAAHPAPPHPAAKPAPKPGEEEKKD